MYLNIKIKSLNIKVSATNVQTQISKNLAQTIDVVFSLEIRGTVPQLSVATRNIKFIK